MGHQWRLRISMIGKGAIRAAGRRRLSGASYTAEAVDFDGTNDYMTRGSLTGAADSKTGLISGWFHPASFATLQRAVWFDDSSTGLGIRQASSAIGSFLRSMTAGRTTSSSPIQGTGQRARSSFMMGLGRVRRIRPLDGRYLFLS